jgi:predicted RNase H-like nuclease (RuvC/YqgF family)
MRSPLKRVMSHDDTYKSLTDEINELSRKMQEYNKSFSKLNENQKKWLINAEKKMEKLMSEYYLYECDYFHGNPLGTSLEKYIVR